MIFYSFRSLVIAYVILIAVVLSVLLLTLSNFLSQEKHLRNVNISRVSLQKLEPASANFNEFVSGLNSYINARGEQNLNFYTRGLEKLKKDSLQIIEIANSVSATQNMNEYRTLAGLLHEITTLASSVLHTNDTKGFDAARADFKNGSITKISSTFKTLFEKLQADNRRVLREAYNRNTQLIRRTFIYTGIISVLLIVLLVAVARSIKKRIRAEEKLQRFNEGLEKQVNEKTRDIKESAAQLSLTASIAKLGYWELDLKTNIFTFTDQLYAIFKTTAEKVGGYTMSVDRYFKLFLHPDDFERIGKEIEKITKSGEHKLPCQVEHRIFYATGEVGYISVNIFLVKDDKGNSIKTFGVNQDITERKKAEDAIRESEERYRALVENAPEALVVLDMENQKFVNVSESAVKLFKMSKEKLLEIGPLDVSPTYQPDGKLSSESAIEKLNEATAGGKPCFEWTHCDTEGNLIPCEIWLVRLPSENQVLIRGSIVDISERKKAEETLNNSELRFRTLTGSAPVGIFQTDATGKTTYVNETWMSYTGMKFEEALGDGWVEAVHPDDKKALIKGWYDLSQKGASSSTEYRLVHKNGDIRWVSGNAVPVFNKAGEITGYIGTISDVTERKNAEQLIRNSEETRRLIMNSALDAIICMDIQGYITVWTPQAEKIFGWKEQEVMGKIMANIIIPEQYREQHKKGFAHYLKTSEGPMLNRIFEITALNNEGNEFPVEMSIIPIKQDHTEFFCAFIRDISNRKKSEAELEESYKAIRKLTAHLQNIREEERTHMAREIHDELGQHLTVLKMDISWLSKKINRSADDVAKEKIKDLLNIIDGTIKTVRRISTELRPSLLDDLGLVAALEWQLGEFEKRSGIKTNFKEPGEEIQLASAVKTGLFRIFQESLTNVARHAGASKVKVSLVQTQSSVELNITDNGKGFDKLKIADKRTLGLLGMRERTAMIGGTYDIISTPGKGTTVVVTIPLERNSVEELV